MINTNITNLRKNLFGLLEQTVKYNEPLSVTTKDGNAVILSEQDYNGLLETLHLSSVAGLKEQLIEGLNTPVDECVPESELQW
ncbi:MAG: type II toxin-antitoxin system Phd/YefM family antitoxin [Oscillospiraceae bacterium]|jgi:PHD/YefM family antitoxin component YafN of YafNO toxin-antitoxin module|nr:type II toxin-antitoxin system Phd/YefM family antitoxin [Oscillospiraceae bacterium]